MGLCDILLAPLLVLPHWYAFDFGTPNFIRLEIRVLTRFHLRQTDIRNRVLTISSNSSIFRFAFAILK